NPIGASHVGQGHPRLISLLHHALLLFSAKPSSALHRQYLDFCTRYITMSGHVSYSCCLDIRPVLISRGLIHICLALPVIQSLADGRDVFFVTDASSAVSRGASGVAPEQLGNLAEHATAVFIRETRMHSVREA